MSKESFEWVYRDLIYKHQMAARAKKEDDRSRLFSLINELEWAYPNETRELIEMDLNKIES
ncbi:MAG: hypothetical protein AAFR68_04195 [Pseudomonadota bacterium]